MSVNEFSVEIELDARVISCAIEVRRGRSRVAAHSIAVAGDDADIN